MPQTTTSNAILAATRLYHAALSLSAYDVSTAYFSLVMAVECLSGHHLSQRKFNFDDVEKFKKVNEVITKLPVSSEIVDELKREILRTEYFVWQKFRTFIQDFLPEEFWQQKDELHPDLHGTVLLEIDKLKLVKALSKVYSARSKFTHAGTPFPAYVEFGIGDRMTSKAAAGAMNIEGSSNFVPPFIWFERLAHSVLCEYLFRVIAPEIAEDRARQAIEKAHLFETINGLCERQRDSLKRLTHWTVRFVGAAVVNPGAPNREWALDEASIRTLRSAGVIEGAPNRWTEILGLMIGRSGRRLGSSSLKSIRTP